MWLGLQGERDAGLMDMREGMRLFCLPMGRGMPSSRAGRSPLALWSSSDSMLNCRSDVLKSCAAHG